MRPKLGKLGILFVATVMVLSGIGGAFAAWTDKVEIEGTVDTGELCVKFDTFVTILDPHEPDHPGGDYVGQGHTLADWTCDDGFENIRQSDKNVAWGEIELVNDDKTLEVELHNAYPSYFNEIGFYPRNCGSIPWRIDHVVLSWEKTDGTSERVLITSSATDVLMDMTGNNEPDMELWYGDNFGAQAHPSERVGEISFWIHVLQEAPQLETFKFSIEVVVVQWNKYPLPLS